MYMLRTNEHDPQSTIKKTNYRCGLVVKWKKKKSQMLSDFPAIVWTKKHLLLCNKDKEKDWWLLSKTGEYPKVKMLFLNREVLSP